MLLQPKLDGITYFGRGKGIGSIQTIEKKASSGISENAFLSRDRE